MVNLSKWMLDKVITYSENQIKRNEKLIINKEIDESIFLENFRLKKENSTIQVFPLNMIEFLRK